jgi:tetratricopeptide (TPR) repeat protein
VWLGIKPESTGKTMLKQRSRSTQTPAKRSISPKRTARRKATLSEKDRLLLRELREQGLGHARNGQYKKAETSYRRRLVIMAQKGGSGYHAVPAAINDLAYVLREQNRHNEAEALYRETIKICKDRGKGENLSVAVASEGLAKIYIKEGKLKKIDPLYQVAIKIWDRVRGPDNANSLAIKQSRAELFEKLGRKDEAKALKDYVFKARKRLW